MMTKHKEPQIKRRGFMLILSSPSGAGKTSISRAILEHVNDIRLSISHTTRPMRPGEKEGTDYHFTDPETFKKDIKNHKFLEHAHVFGHYYGTPKSNVYDHISKGKDVLFDIEWQGTQQLKQSARDDVVSIFILPPSLQALEERLLKRAQDTMETVKKRMSLASNEVSHWAEYDYIIINHDFEKSVEHVRSILYAERLKRERQLGLPDFVNILRNCEDI